MSAQERVFERDNVTEHNKWHPLADEQARKREAAFQHVEELQAKKIGHRLWHRFARRTVRIWVPPDPFDIGFNLHTRVYCGICGLYLCTPQYPG
jgi:hypothetical protein